MVPFVLCAKHTCSKINTCYRYRASPDTDQRYDTFPKLCDTEDSYSLFMMIRPEDQIIDLDLNEIPENIKENENTDNL